MIEETACFGACMTCDSCTANAASLFKSSTIWHSAARWTLRRLRETKRKSPQFQRLSNMIGRFSRAVSEGRDPSSLTVPSSSVAAIPKRPPRSDMNDNTARTSAWPSSMGDFCFQKVSLPSVVVRAANCSVTAGRLAVMSKEHLRKCGHGLVADTGRNPRNPIVA
jgi:hypothetical protein